MTAVAPLGAAPQSEQQPLAAILWILLTTALFVALDTIAKWLTTSLPVNQVVWGRFFFHAFFLAIFLNHRLHLTLHSRRPWLQLLRSAMLLATTSLFFTGLKYLEIATASAIMLVTPLLVTLLSVPVLGEAVGWRRIVSVFIGFGGALIIIRPGSDVLGLAALLPLAAAVTHSGYNLSTRVLARSDSSTTTLAYTALVGAFFSSFFLLVDWKTPDAGEWLGLMTVGLIGCLGHFCLIKAFSLANAAVVAPFFYATLLWATLFGFLVFASLPDLWTICGAALIVGSGLYVLYRERVKKGQKA